MAETTAAAAITTTATTTTVTNPALLVFSASLVRQLSTKDGRLEPTYVGVRRVRPSSRMVQKAFALGKTTEDEVNLAIINQHNNDAPTTTTCTIPRVSDKHDADTQSKKEPDETSAAAADDGGTASTTTKTAQKQPHHNDHTTTTYYNNNANDTWMIPPAAESSPVVYKVVQDDGTERRMTKQEKKAMKYQMLQERKVAKQEQQRIKDEQNRITMMEKRKEKKKGSKRKREETVHSQNDNNENVADSNNDPSTDMATATSCSRNDVAVDADSCIGGPTTEEDDDMKELENVGTARPKSVSELEQELADLRGDRQGVPPVILSPSLAQAAFWSERRLLGLSSSSKSAANMETAANNTVIMIDDDLAQEWANALTESMLPALKVRGREDMRSMAYEILPEVWSRLRPDSLASGVRFNVSNDNNPLANKSTHLQSDVAAVGEEVAQPKVDNQEQVQQHDNNDEAYALVTIRPPSSFDTDLNAVVGVLHHHTPLFLSCGAKFGCDLLLYDGPRSERHAFAGLRLMETNHGHQTNDSDDNDNSSAVLPIPSAYTMAAFVRCLNTAGKLALLATVRREPQSADGSVLCRVALVDLKLNRVDGTKRKDITKLLQKLGRSSANNT